MGAAVVIIAFLPRLDRSPVKSIRYRACLQDHPDGLRHLFFILGYLGVPPPSPAVPWCRSSVR